jgi:hypothetical protein
MPRHFENARPRWQTGETSQKALNKLANRLHTEWVTNGNEQFVHPQTEILIPRQPDPTEHVSRQLAQVALNSNDKR